MPNTNAVNWACIFYLYQCNIESNPVMPSNILPQNGPNPQKVIFMGPTPDRPNYILLGPDRIESFYH